MLRAWWDKRCNVARMVTSLWEVYRTWERLLISELERVLPSVSVGGLEPGGGEMSGVTPGAAAHLPGTVTWSFASPDFLCFLPDLESEWGQRNMSFSGSQTVFLELKHIFMQN